MTQGGVRSVWNGRKPLDRGDSLIKELFPAELRHREQGHELLTLAGDDISRDIPEHLPANPAKLMLPFLGPVFQELPCKLAALSRRCNGNTRAPLGFPAPCSAPY